MTMSRKDAVLITGGLSNPSKMPGNAYCLPAKKSCPRGRCLARIPGTICSVCYGDRGRYVFPKVQAAMERRLGSLRHPAWEQAMILLIGSHKCRYFRWHSCGDMPTLEYLERIMRIAVALPQVHFWLPTQENDLIARWLESPANRIPANMVVRLSSEKFGGIDPFPESLQETPGVLRSGVDCTGPDITSCMSHTHGHVCGSCRKCWSRKVKVVSYKKH